MNADLILADYTNQKHAEDILYLLNQYALDSAGGGKELNTYAKENLITEEVEKVAKERGACKITLEVLEKNIAAANAYAKFGFVGYGLDPRYGNAVFLEKTI